MSKMYDKYSDKHPIENLPRQLLSSMIEQLKFELYDETSFLKENPEFQSLLRRYGEYLER